MADTTPCKYCGKMFERNGGPGRPADYCSRVHRQRAYEGRQKFYTRETLMELARILGMECYICGVALDEESIQFDHVIPLSLDGPDEPENIRPVCLICNATKGAKLMFVPADSV